MVKFFGAEGPSPNVYLKSLSSVAETVNSGSGMTGVSLNTTSEAYATLICAALK